MQEASGYSGAEQPCGDCGSGERGEDLSCEQRGSSLCRGDSSAGSAGAGDHSLCQEPEGGRGIKQADAPGGNGEIISGSSGWDSLSGAGQTGRRTGKNTGIQLV